MYKGLRRLVRNFFGFSHGEAKGFLLLLCLLLALSLGYGIYKSLPGQSYTSYAEDKALLDSLIATIELQEQEEAGPALANSPARENPAREEVVVPRYFSFDPNQLSADSLQLLGLPHWLANRIVKYRKKGGSFRTKEDLRKIYGLSDSTFEQLMPYITIRNPRPSETSASKAYSNNLPPGSTAYKRDAKKPPVRLDINQADSLELQVVRGIGPVLSGRIVRFRQKLGGFVSLNQLYEVWGLDSAVVETMQGQTFIQEEFRPANLNINSATVEELAQHPYISPSQARLLEAYRQQHGAFTSANDLLKIHTFNSDFVNKIAPYILLD
jgi:competence protein ComEA